jgi:Helix-turn-helix domain
MKPTSSIDAPGLPLAHTIADATRISGISRSALYLAIARGDLAARKLGKRTLILAADLAAFLNRLPPMEPAAK